MVFMKNVLLILNYNFSMLLNLPQINYCIFCYYHIINNFDFHLHNNCLDIFISNIRLSVPSFLHIHSYNTPFYSTYYSHICYIHNSYYTNYFMGSTKHHQDNLKHNNFDNIDIRLNMFHMNIHLYTLNKEMNSHSKILH